MEQYSLEKYIWTEKDFNEMGWHDSSVYGIRLADNLELDIDYILKWNKPEVEGFPFTFWISPATLIFKKPTELAFELNPTFDEVWFEIENIELSIMDKSNYWTITTRQGNISFLSDSYTQIIRHKPTIQFGQSISYDERGGFSFGLAPGDNKQDNLKPEISERREREFKLYEFAKERFKLKKELNSLLDFGNSGQTPTKEFLTKKSDLKLKINSFNKELIGTRFENW